MVLLLISPWAFRWNFLLILVGNLIGEIRLMGHQIERDPIPMILLQVMIDTPLHFRGISAPGTAECLIPGVPFLVPFHFAAILGGVVAQITTIAGPFKSRSLMLTSFSDIVRQGAVRFLVVVLN